MKTVVLASRNQGKLREFKKMLKSLAVDIMDLSNWSDIVEPEETGQTFLANAELKASYYAKKTGNYCLADDSGLEVLALGGAPGVYSARYAGDGHDDKANNGLLLKNMLGKDNRDCRFCCSLALAQPDGKIILTAEGFCEGLLLEQEDGENGFGYDPLFYSKDLQKSLGQATDKEKNLISHRSRALQELVKLWSEKVC